MPTRVLVIDDDIVLTNIFKASLEQEGFEVYVANSGSEGIQAAREVEPDVVMVDLMMPIVDGWQVCREIRTFSQVPILVLSAVIDTQMVMRALDEGATDYLVKPVPPGTMISHLKKLTQHSTD
jgi:DNA-binding response OmpR family regulator